MRLPSRIVPISVSDPMGLAMPFSDRHDARNGSGGNRAETNEQNAEFALGWIDRYSLCHGRKLYHPA